MGQAFHKHRHVTCPGPALPGHNRHVDPETAFQLWQLLHAGRTAHCQSTNKSGGLATNVCGNVPSLRCHLEHLTPSRSVTLLCLRITWTSIMDTVLLPLASSGNALLLHSLQCSSESPHEARPTAQALNKQTNETFPNMCSL